MTELAYKFLHLPHLTGLISWPGKSVSFVLKSSASLEIFIHILSFSVSFQEFEMRCFIPLSRMWVQCYQPPLWPLFSPGGAPIYPLCVFEGFSFYLSVQPLGWLKTCRTGLCSAGANREGMNGFQCTEIDADPQGLLMVGRVLLIAEEEVLIYASCVCFRGVNVRLPGNC